VHSESYQFNFEVYDSSSELNEEDRKLFDAATDATSLSYAPYSKFYVGAAARLKNGEIIKGANQENASFPAGLCAEGTVLANAAVRFPGMAIDTLAITFRSDNTPSDNPIAPCGICRQSLQEFRERTGEPVRLIMGGKQGKVIVVEDASYLMPFSFKF
jgi:cytidine deaminase